MVYKLHKVLYDLKQDPRAWYSKQDFYFQKQGFQRSANEYILYTKVGDQGEILLVCVYVDDLICMGSSQLFVENFRKDMKKTFEMNDLGLMSYFLGLEIKQDALGIHVSQKKYVEELLKSYNMLNCIYVSTPLSPILKLQMFDEEEAVDAIAYR